MFRSIRWRLVLSYVGLILLTLSVVGAVILSLVEDSVQRQELEYLTSSAEAVADQARPLIWPRIQQLSLQELAETSAFLSNAQVRILDASLRVLADASRGEESVTAWILLPEAWEGDLPLDASAPFEFQFPFGKRLVLPATSESRSWVMNEWPGDAAVTVVSWRQRVWGGGFELRAIQTAEQLRAVVDDLREAPRSQQVVSVPIGSRDNPLGYVEIGSGPDFVPEALATTRRAFVFAAVGALALAVVVGLVVSQGLAAPLRTLTQAADRMSGGDLSARAPIRGSDEIGQLASQFNQMAARLEASFAELAADRDALRRFIADASHELRNPIAALRSFNELLQGAAARDESARQEFLAESQHQIDRLEWVTGHLLDLSRLDAGLAALELATHPATDLIGAVLPTYRALASDKQVQILLVEPDPGLEVRCDWARIELALSNLLDNAVKFTPPGGLVQVGASDHGEVLHLWVEDQGPGILDDDLPYIFDRFYRGKDAGPDGTGLGLSIAQSIAQAHGGRVFVETEAGEGSRFIIELPA